MNSVEQRIRRFREKKGFSQDYMALELEISQASYARLENGDTQLSVERLMQIAKILQVHFSQLVGEEPQNVFHQQNNSGPSGYFEKIENLYTENSKTIEKLLESKDETIAQLQKEIDFLRNLLADREI